MRLIWIALLSGATSAIAEPVFLDGFEDPPSVSMQSPEIELLANEEKSVCYYARSANTQTMAVQRWEIENTPGVAHAAWFATYDGKGQPAELFPEGTLQSPCVFNPMQPPGWLFGTRKASASLQFPGDDGTGVPLAFELAPQQPLVLRIDAVNATASAIQVHARATAIGRTPGFPYTQAASFIAHNQSFLLPFGVTTVNMSCAAPVGAKFFWLTMHTRQLASNAVLRDDATLLLQSGNWQNPAELFPSPVYAFGSTFDTACTYSNPTGNFVHPGDSETGDEICQGIGYFFPATRPLVCINGAGPF